MSEWQPIATAPRDGTVLLIPLNGTLAAKISASDLPLVARFKRHARPRRDGRGFYAVNSGGIRMHRLLMGVWDSRVVDHRDGDGLNNTRANLRIGSQSQNCVNRRTTPGPHLRGARPKKGKWQAYIKLNGNQRSLGYFATEEAAHAAYLAEAAKLHGDWMPNPAPPAQEAGQ